ncbi:ovomucoid-like isoform X1 [Pelodiscus sinensis]|uniref:ovomucoid-like isoform X1 n=1 Tax=Pelodiscus sinensis TaxID=13735 RepID=UPI003F6D535A
MTITGAVLLFALALYCSFSDADGHHHLGFCTEYSTRPIVCSDHFNPICGSDDKTYLNKCTFCLAAYEQRGSLCFQHYGKCKRTPRTGHKVEEL